MTIAVTYENGQIFPHFGHTEQFKVYEVENNKITASRVVDTNGQGHGALASFLCAIGAKVVICGGIGGGAKAALKEAGIALFGGVSGNCDDAVDAYLKGSLSYNPDIQCSHHGAHHHGQGEQCGDHGCAGHNCAGNGHC